MNEREERLAAVELLLREPEIVAWLEELPRPKPDEEEGDDEPPLAA